MSQKVTDYQFVTKQYRNASKFDARVQMYKEFGVKDESWTEWLFHCLRLKPGEAVLEIGSGTGNVWADNRQYILDDMYLILSDLSHGILKTAQERLSQLTTHSFQYQCIDAQALPFTAQYFDVLLANGVFYHVPDVAKAISEAHRVLQTGGRFYVGTNDWTHLIEIRELMQRFQLKSAMLPPGRVSNYFDLENAAELLSRRFSTLHLHRRRDVLKITNTDILLGYIQSMVVDEPQIEGMNALRQHVNRQIELLGSVDVTVSVGLIEAAK